MTAKAENFVFFTKYSYSGASSRYRVYQYLPYFQKAGFTTRVNPFFSDEYLKNKYNGKHISGKYIIKRYLKRIKDILSLKRSDLVYIEYELLPYFPAWFERWMSWRKLAYVVDYDDAIFHNYDKSNNPIIKLLLHDKISSVIYSANQVITGSEYLTNYARKFNREVIEIPTSLDFHKYQFGEKFPKTEIFTIGWIGTPSNSNNIINILEPIKEFLGNHKAKMLLIGFDKLLQHYFKGMAVEIRDWNAESEVRDIKSFSVGIMPLIDTPFNRGKCGFKLIQYMAAGIPTISTPLPANLNINKKNENLFASNSDEWIEALEKVYNDQTFFCEDVASNNQELVEKYYSIQANHTRFLEVFKTPGN